MKFDFSMLSAEDCKIFLNFIDDYVQPDLIIAPDGNPYLYRWYVTPRNRQANVYLHVQVDDDPKRPLHDHPWDNVSVILSGGYRETISWSEGEPAPNTLYTAIRNKGDTIFRRARQAHRLELPNAFMYTMTLFSTGPKIHNWGFWYPEGHVPYEEVTRTENGVSVHINPGGM